jgi:hypothetical protein
LANILIICSGAGNRNSNRKTDSINHPPTHKPATMAGEKQTPPTQIYVLVSPSPSYGLAPSVLSSNVISPTILTAYADRGTAEEVARQGGFIAYPTVIYDHYEYVSRSVRHLCIC